MFRCPRTGRINLYSVHTPSVACTGDCCPLTLIACGGLPITFNATVLTGQEADACTLDSGAKPSA